MRTRRLLPLLALATWLAACDSSTSPPLRVPLDTDAALADYDAVAGLLTSSELAALGALSGRMPLSGSGAGVPSAAGAPAAAPLISATYRGSTFVYDPATDEYVIDPTRTGAPATGVRFVLYEVDVAGAPILAEEIGHADLIDEGDGSAEDVVLHLLVVTNGQTVLDYRTTVDVGLTFADVGVLGFLQGDAGVRLDFDIDVGATKTFDQTTLDIGFDIAVDARDFSISGRLSGIEEGSDGSGDVLVTVRHGTHELEVDMSGQGGQLDGSIFLDGALFATVSGDPQSPTLVSADGDPLTPAEVLVLHRMIDTLEDVFDFLEDLVDPVDDLVVLGFILS